MLSPVKTRQRATTAAAGAADFGTGVTGVAGVVEGEGEGEGGGWEVGENDWPPPPPYKESVQFGTTGMEDADETTTRLAESDHFSSTQRKLLLVTALRGEAVAEARVESGVEGGVESEVEGESEAAGGLVGNQREDGRVGGVLTAGAAGEEQIEEKACEEEEGEYTTDTNDATDLTEDDKGDENADPKGSESVVAPCGHRVHHHRICRCRPTYGKSAADVEPIKRRSVASIPLCLQIGLLRFGRSPRLGFRPRPRPTQA